MIALEFRRLRPHAVLPTRAHPGDAGWDLYAPDQVVLYPGKVVSVPLGIAWACPHGYCAQIVGRSGLAAKGIGVLGGLIDCGYRGEWVALLTLAARAEMIVLSAGSRVAQFLVLPVPAVAIAGVDTLSLTERGTGGFGSTGD